MTTAIKICCSASLHIQCALSSHELVTLRTCSVLGYRQVIGDRECDGAQVSSAMLRNMSLKAVMDGDSVVAIYVLGL